ncbi:beta-1,3-galactosyltransferase 6 [Eurosta solidaginis]|uniref:beta-1,3-galactosyltransferase 6 n=1 Tax=Eurosta solidaginis TaxID=178769 RepID=UPI003530BB52
MRRTNNLVTLFTAMVAFFFGCFLSNMLTKVDRCLTHKSGVNHMEPHPDIFLMILMLTNPASVNRRQIMRQTWLRLGVPLELPYYPENLIYLPKYHANGHLQLESVADQSTRLTAYLQWLENNMDNASNSRRIIKVKYFFAIGTENLSWGLRASVEREQKSYRDILLLPRITESFENLTEKVLHSIEALTNHYKFSYFLKVDDDTYVKLDLLLNELISYDRKLTRKSNEYKGQTLPALYWGYFNGKANVQTKGKWRDPNYHLSTHYLTYAQGGGYLISRHICEHIAGNAQSLAVYVNEDVSLGLWIAPLRYVYRRHDPRFDTSYRPRKCRRYHLVKHKVDENDMQQLYDGSVCIKGRDFDEKETPTEYLYDWSKPASKCCDTGVLVH